MSDLQQVEPATSELWTMAQKVHANRSFPAPNLTNQQCGCFVFQANPLILGSAHATCSLFNRLKSSWQTSGFFCFFFKANKAKIEKHYHKAGKEGDGDLAAIM